MNKPDVTTPPKLLNVKEMAQTLGVPASWLYQRTRLGQSAIPHIKVGKYIRFQVEEVMEFLKAKQVNLSSGQ